MLRKRIAWATHGCLEPFVPVAKTIPKQLAGIVARVATEISVGRGEDASGTVRTNARRASGRHTADSVIAALLL